MVSLITYMGESKAETGAVRRPDERFCEELVVYDHIRSMKLGKD